MDHLPPTTCGFSELQNGLSTEEESCGGEGGEGEALCNGVEGLSEMGVEVELAPIGEVLACLGGRGLFGGGKKSLSGSTGGGKTAGVPDLLALPFDFFSRRERILVSFSRERRREILAMKEGESGGSTIALGLGDLSD